MVEDLFSYEVSIAEDTRSDLTNKKLWGEVGISEESRPTKHTQCTLKSNELLHSGSKRLLPR
jgi:hypothetical protein